MSTSRGWAVAAALLVACGGTAPAPWHGRLVLRDVPVADVTRQDGAALTWTITHHLVDGDVGVVRQATLAADGTLDAYRLERADLTLQVDFDGAGIATWRRLGGGVEDAGTLHLPARPRWVLGTGWADVPAGTRAWLWSDDTAVAVFVARQAGTVSLSSDDGQTWALVTDAAGAVVSATFPDGAVLTSAGDGAIAAVDPVALLRIDADPLVRPRTLRRLTARWSTGGPSFTLTRPDRAELGRPAIPTQQPTTQALSLPDGTPALDVPLAATDRLALLEAAHAATRSQHGGTAWTPDRADCRALASTLAGILRHHGVGARTVHGWVAIEGDPTVLERHAWVEVPWSDALPWLQTDPALGQLIADASHIPDTLAPHPLRPETRLVVEEAVGLDGPQP